MRRISNPRAALAAALLLAGASAWSASLSAQQPSPAPSFAESNLTPSGIRALAANCAACHGTLGKVQPDSPVSGLAGRQKDELASLMRQFRDGRKPATLMHQIAKGYSDAEIDAMADFFSKQAR